MPVNRAQQIRERLTQIDRRSQEVIAEIESLGRHPRAFNDAEWQAEVGLPRRDELGKEQQMLLEERKRLSEEYDRLPDDQKQV